MHTHNIVTGADVELVRGKEYFKIIHNAYAQMINHTHFLHPTMANDVTKY